MKRNIILITLAAICLCSQSVLGQKRTFAVEIEVSAKSKDLQEKVESYISRDLRTLGDVEIVTEKPLYSLKVIVMETRNGDTLSGYAISVVTVNNVACTTGRVRRSCAIFQDHALYVDSEEKLRPLTDEIVTDFDIRHLKDLRINRAPR